MAILVRAQHRVYPHVHRLDRRALHRVHPRLDRVDNRPRLDHLHPCPSLLHVRCRNFGLEDESQHAVLLQRPHACLHSRRSVASQRAVVESGTWHKCTATMRVRRGSGSAVHTALRRNQGHLVTELSYMWKRKT